MNALIAWLLQQVVQMLDELPLRTARDEADLLDMPAYGKTLQRASDVLQNAARLADGLKRINVLPLGSGALAGSTICLDREFVAERLGFELIGHKLELYGTAIEGAEPSKREGLIFTRHAHRVDPDKLDI